MKIPESPTERAAVMAEYIAGVEARGEKRAFSATNFPLIDSDLQVAEMGRLLGCGCEYFFYQLEDGLVITTYRGNGPWPYASVEWVFGEPCQYEEAVLRALLIDGRDSGTSEPNEMRAMIARTMAEVMP